MYNTFFAALQQNFSKNFFFVAKSSFTKSYAMINITAYTVSIVHSLSLLPFQSQISQISRFATQTYRACLFFMEAN